MNINHKKNKARTSADTEGVSGKERAMIHLVDHVLEVVDDGASLGGILFNCLAEMGMPPATRGTIANMVDAGIDSHLNDIEKEAVNVF